MISVNMVEAGPTCESASSSAAAHSVQVSLELDSASPRARESERSIALNTQGYSYREPGVDAEARRLEAR